MNGFEDATDRELIFYGNRRCIRELPGPMFLNLMDEVRKRGLEEMIKEVV